MFQFYRNKKLYKVEKSYGNFSKYWWNYTCSFFSSDKRKELAFKCEEKFDEELDIHDLIVKLRQVKEHTSNEAFINDFELEIS